MVPWNCEVESRWRVSLPPNPCHVDEKSLFYATLEANAAKADGEQHAYRPYTPSASGASAPQRAAT